MTGGRYERQILLPEIGVGGQARLSASSALVVGCGGLGCTLLLSLSSIGVGRIGFCDGDIVAEHNLNRQFLHTPADIGRKKVLSAYEKLSAYAPELALEPYELFITRGKRLRACIRLRYHITRGGFRRRAAGCEPRLCCCRYSASRRRDQRLSWVGFFRPARKNGLPGLLIRGFVAGCRPDSKFCADRDRRRLVGSAVRGKRSARSAESFRRTSAAL